MDQTSGSFGDGRGGSNNSVFGYPNNDGCNNGVFGYPNNDGCNNGGLGYPNNTLSGLSLPGTRSQTTDFEFSAQPNNSSLACPSGNGNHEGPTDRMRCLELVLKVQDLEPLELNLTITDEFLDSVQNTLNNARRRNSGEMNATSHQSIQPRIQPTPQASEKLKAANFPIRLLKIGSWEKRSAHEGQLVAKCYYSKRKLVWEILDGSLKTKIEIQWSDIASMRATCKEGQHGILELELTNRPQFGGETELQPKKHTIWQKIPDFTGGQASNYRRHFIMFPPGVLEKQYEKLVQYDAGLYNLSKKPLPSLKSPFFPLETNQEPTPRALMPPPPPANPTPLPPAQPLQTFNSVQVQPPNTFNSTSINPMALQSCYDQFDNKPPANPTPLPPAQPLQTFNSMALQSCYDQFDNKDLISTDPTSLPTHRPPPNLSEQTLTNPTFLPSLRHPQPPLQALYSNPASPPHIFYSTLTNPTSLQHAQPPLQALHPTYVRPLSIFKPPSTNPAIFSSLPPSQSLPSFERTFVPSPNIMESASPMSDNGCNNPRVIQTPELCGREESNRLMGSEQVLQEPNIVPAMLANPCLDFQGSLVRNNSLDSYIFEDLGNLEDIDEDQFDRPNQDHLHPGPAIATENKQLNFQGVDPLQAPLLAISVATENEQLNTTSQENQTMKPPQVVYENQEMENDETEYSLAALVNDVQMPDLRWMYQFR